MFIDVFCCLRHSKRNCVVPILDICHSTDIQSNNLRKHLEKNEKKSSLGEFQESFGARRSCLKMYRWDNSANDDTSWMCWRTPRVVVGSFQVKLWGSWTVRPWKVTRPQKGSRRVFQSHHLSGANCWTSRVYHHTGWFPTSFKLNFQARNCGIRSLRSHVFLFGINLF